MSRRFRHWAHLNEGGKKVISIRYKGYSDAEKNRVMKQILQNLKINEEED